MSTPRIAPRVVVLPWAPQLPSSYEAPAGPGAAALAPASASARPQLRYGAPVSELPPELRALGLPYAPPPSLPDSDRAPATRDELMRAAVALDVLGTDLGRIAATPSVLHALTGALARTGRLAGLDAAALAELLSFADGPAGVDRALVSRELAACTAAARGAGEPTPSTPESVAAAVAHVVGAARIAVRDATLLVQTGPLVEYRGV
jgi:hypothetical protein